MLQIFFDIAAIWLDQSELVGFVPFNLEAGLTETVNFYEEVLMISKKRLNGAQVLKRSEETYVWTPCPSTDEAAMQFGAHRREKSRAKSEVSGAFAFGDPILRPAEAARYLGIGKSSLYRLVDLGQLPRAIRLTEQATGWRLSTLEGYLAQREEAAQ